MDRRKLLIGVSAASVGAFAGKSRAQTAPAAAIGVASAPNPHVFPLLLAMEREPNLPVRLLPIAESRQADALLTSGEAAAMLAMTYIGVRKRMSGAAPDLRLHSIFFWRGFYQVAGEDVRTFADLRGRTVVVSGPLGAGRGGGGDIIFQAAARRQGIDPMADLTVEYLPVSEGIERVASGVAAGITLPSPGSTGLVTRALMARRPVMAAMARARGFDPRPSVPLAAHIDFQQVFSGFASFPAGQLPLGGLHATERALADAAARAKVDAVAAAYAQAAELLVRDPGAHAERTTAAFSRYFQPLGASGPSAMLLARAIESGDLVYRSDIAPDMVRADFAAWLAELNGQGVDAVFFDRG